MKRGTLLLMGLAGTAVFLVVLVLYLPAAWFASMLPPQVRCADLGGSVWHGECLGLTFQNGKLGDATWNFSPAGALGGKLRGDLDVQGGALTAHAEVATSFRGVGELRNVVARFPLDPAFIADMPPDKRGNISANLKSVSIGEQLAVGAVEGTIEARDVRQVSEPQIDFGSYQLTFDGKTREDGAPAGTLRDLGGPFRVEGTVVLSAPNTYVVKGYVTGRTAQAESLVRRYTLPPDASGRSEFRFETSY
jgi:hypothetical protein